METFEKLIAKHGLFIPRSIAEKDTKYLIPIPCAVVSERASRHIGIVYGADLSSPHVALALHQKEFAKREESQ